MNPSADHAIRPPQGPTAHLPPFIPELKQRLLEGDRGVRDGAWRVLEVTGSVDAPQRAVIPESAAGFPHSIWSSRDHEELFEAWGAVHAWRYDSIEQVSDGLPSLCEWLVRQPERLRVFGGRRFAEKGDGGAWQDFPAGLFWAPRLLRVRSGTLERWMIWLRQDDDEDRDLKQALVTLEALRPATGEDEAPAAVAAGPESPSLSHWTQSVEEVLQACRDSELQKVVLARRKSAQSSRALSPRALFRRLRGMTPYAFHYYISLHPRAAYFGASPERLYARSGRHVETEAVAGTRPRGASEAEDAALGRALLASEKDGREHRLVRDEIARQLQPLSQAVRVDAENRLIHQAASQHLYAAISADLREEVTDADLLHRLHPTPAVGGLPAGAALDLLRKREQMDRGWYAAPFGWMSRRAAEFTVAIRGGLVRDRRIDWFAGAGIVPGSDPLAEWEEVEQKMSLFSRLVSLDDKP